MQNSKLYQGVQDQVKKQTSEALTDGQLLVSNVNGLSLPDGTFVAGVNIQPGKFEKEATPTHVIIKLKKIIN